MRVSHGDARPPMAVDEPKMVKPKRPDYGADGAVNAGLERSRQPKRRLANKKESDHHVLTRRPFDGHLTRPALSPTTGRCGSLKKAQQKKGVETKSNTHR